MEIPPICINCENYKKESSCKAFKEIPSKIWSEGNDHTTPLEGQENEIVFEPLKDYEI